MAVRESLLGILTLGPAYGLQLHAELGSRAPHRAKTNVGQVYGTLDRLNISGLVTNDGHTLDGLPLYALTPIGMNEAQAWLRGDNLSTVPEWTDLQDMLLISSSINSNDATALMKIVEKLTEIHAELGGNSPAVNLHQQAQVRYHQAVRNWIGDIRLEGIPQVDRFSTIRPKRGRPRASAKHQSSY